MKKTRKKYIESCEVSEVITVTLGGYPQRIAIEGREKSLPVVICLHGGPGSPVPFSVGARGLFPDWTDKAVMVYWDQLGCGINNRKIDNSFTIESFVEMTCDLAVELKRRFPENKLYLFGVSWGSILSLKAALRIPELLSGVFVYGQFIKNNFFSEEVVNAFASAPKKIQNEVNKVVKTGADCKYTDLYKNLQKLFRYMHKYTNAYFNKNAEPIKISEIAKGLFTSPDYRLRDFIAVVKNGYRHNESLWGEAVRIDLANELCGVRIPYFILQGDTDIVTSTNTVCKAVQNCGNENVTVKIVENSGHMPSGAGMEEAIRALTEFIQ